MFTPYLYFAGVVAPVANPVNVDTDFPDTRYTKGEQCSRGNGCNESYHVKGPNFPICVLENALLYINVVILFLTSKVTKCLGYPQCNRSFHPLARHESNRHCPRMSHMLHRCYRVVWAFVICVRMVTWLGKAGWRVMAL